MSNPILTQIQLPSGTIYDLHDTRVDSINNWEYTVCTNAANTPQGVTWTSGSTTVTGTLVASADTMYKIYLVPDNNGTNDIYDEYITVRTGSSSSYTYTWEMFGNTKLPDMTQYLKNQTGKEGSTAGDLAYKNGVVVTPLNKDVTVKGTPAGTISVGTGTANYTPAGTNASSSVSGSCTVTPNGSVSSTFTGNGVRLQTDSQVLTGATFSGSSMTSTGSLTAGDVEIKPNSTGTAANKYTPAGSISVGTGSANYTPAGTISVGTGTSNYTPAGSNASSSVSGTCSIAANSAVSDMSVSAPADTTASGELVYCSVSGTTLSLQKVIETKSAISGTISGTAAAQTFTGTGAELKFTGTGKELKFTGTDTYFKTASKVVSSNTTSVSVSVSGTTTGSVTPSKSNVTVSPAASGTATYTPSGTVSSEFTGSSSSGSISGTAAAQTFTGTGTNLKFTGNELTSTGAYTPETPTVTYN